MEMNSNICLGGKCWTARLKDKRLEETTTTAHNKLEDDLSKCSGTVKSIRIALERTR